MPRQQLVFGGGLDRVSGAIVASPGSFRTLSNVALVQGRMSLRPGLPRFGAVLPGTHVLGVFPLRSQGFTAFVSYNTATRTATLYVLDSAGTTASIVGALFTVPGGGVSPPSIIADEAYDKLVIAHDEDMQYRQATMVYAPRSNTLDPLTADLARTGVSASVKFRGVKRWLNYLVGWGYGQPGDEDRPETLRISEAGDPTNFLGQHYFLVGGQGDAILACEKVGPAVGVLAVMKLAEAYQLVGYDRATFGIRPLDNEHGVLGSHLAVGVEGELHFWSLDGPRASTGSASDDQGLPLWLDSPNPDPVITPVKTGFVFYDRTAQEVVYVFGANGYVLHLRDGNRRWSHRPYGVPLTAAGTVYTGGTATIATTAWPIIGAIVYTEPAHTGADANPKLSVAWTIGGVPVGTEQAEVWTRSQDGGVWVRRATVAATALTANIIVEDFLTTHDIAIRFTIGGYAQYGYTTSDAIRWPAYSRGTITTGGNFASWARSSVWQRFDAGAQGFAFAWAGPTTGQNPATNQFAAGRTSLQVRKQSSTDAGATWNDIVVDQVPGIIRLDNTFSLVLTRFRIRAEGPNAQGAWSTSPDIMVAPEPPDSVTVDATVGTPGTTDFHTITWAAPLAIGGVLPADGPYDISVHHENGGTISPAKTASVGVGIHTVDIATISHVGYTAPRTVVATVRVNRGSGDLSPIITGTNTDT